LEEPSFEDSRWEEHLGYWALRVTVGHRLEQWLSSEPLGNRNDLRKARVASCLSPSLLGFILIEECRTGNIQCDSSCLSDWPGPSHTPMKVHPLYASHMPDSVKSPSRPASQGAGRLLGFGIESCLWPCSHLLSILPAITMNGSHESLEPGNAYMLSMTVRSMVYKVPIILLRLSLVLIKIYTLLLWRSWGSDCEGSRIVGAGEEPTCQFRTNFFFFSLPVFFVFFFFFLI
jgi:hypothetical protein